MPPPPPSATHLAVLPSSHSAPCRRPCFRRCTATRSPFSSAPPPAELLTSPPRRAPPTLEAPPSSPAPPPRPHHRCRRRPASPPRHHRHLLLSSPAATAQTMETNAEAEEAIRGVDGTDVNGACAVQRGRAVGRVGVRVLTSAPPAAAGEKIRVQVAKSQGPPPKAGGGPARFDDRRGGFDDRRGGGFDDRRGGGFDDRGPPRDNCALTAVWWQQQRNNCCAARSSVVCSALASPPCHRHSAHAFGSPCAPPPSRALPH